MPGEIFPIALTPEEGMALFRRDVAYRVQPSFNSVSVALTQNQVDALGSFIFNVGSGNFRQSTLLQQLNVGNFDAVPGEMCRWNRAGGVVLQGLIWRRADEAALFIEGRWDY